jgi:uncharacterized membrane protein YqiK
VAIQGLRQEEQQADTAVKLAQLEVDRLKGLKDGTGVRSLISPIEQRRADIGLEDLLRTLVGMCYTRARRHELAAACRGRHFVRSTDR